MIMAWSDTKGLLTIAFGDDGRVLEDKERWRKNMGTIWRI